MKILRNFGTVCALGVALAACAQSPTAAADGGHTYGSGNLHGTRLGTSDDRGGYTAGSGGRTLSAYSDTMNVPAVTSGEEMTTDETTTERSGHTVGSGN